ncbi:MAG: tetratricopeptide repeat protein [Candidatus Eremiobacterota bacterium]
MALFCDKCGYENRDDARFCQGCGGAIEIVTQSGRLKAGILLDNRYEIKRLIKAGGMGAVYEALDRRFKNSSCAVKEMLSPSSDDEEDKAYILKRFETEAEILHTLRHPNLPFVRDYFTWEGRYYLVMDYIEGDDLFTILKHYKKEGIDERRVIEWAKEILDALHYMHSQSPPVVYRDLKPGNIMIRNSDNKAILVDFGIARTVEPDVDSTKTVVGTLVYAPEELLHGKPEPRTDIYSLGATMHCLLTGVIPRTALSFGPVRQLNPRVSPELEKILIKSLELRASDRYRNAAEMKEALENISSDVKTDEELTLPPVTDESTIAPVCYEPEGKSSSKITGTDSEKFSDSSKMAGIDSEKFSDSSKISGTDSEKFSDSSKMTGTDSEKFLDSSKMAGIDSEKFSDSSKMAGTDSEKNLDSSKISGTDSEKFLCKKTEPVKVIPGKSDKSSSFLARNTKFIIIGVIATGLLFFFAIITVIILYFALKPVIMTHYYTKGRNFYNKGEYAMALLYCDKALAGSYAPSVTIKAKSLYFQGKYEDSLKECDRAIKIDKNYGPAWNTKGEILENTGNYEQAMECYEKAIETDPDCADALYNKGTLLLAKGFNEGKDYVDKAITIYDEGKGFDKSDIHSWNKLGDALYVRKKYDRSIKCYDESLNINGEYADTWHSKGQVLYYQKKDKEAEDCLNKALTYYDKELESCPLSGVLWNQKGNVFYLKEKYKDAIKCYDKALEILPDNPIIWANKAYAFYEKKHYNEALEYFSKSLEVNSSYVEAMTMKGKIFCEQKKYSDSLDCYEKAIDINPDYSVAWAGRGDVYYEQEKYEKSIDCYNKSIALNPDDALVWNSKGVSLYSIGNYKEAIECYERSLEINPDDDVVKQNKADALKVLGK